MRRLYLLSLSLLSSLLLLTSCDDDEEGCPVPETVDATLVWTGDYAVDGCGYTLRIGETAYKPVNESDIPDAYKASSPTEVEATIINYYRQEEVACGFAGAKMNSIKIISLHKR